MMLQRVEVTEQAKWNEAVLSLPGPHLLQSWQWGEVKAKTGWQPNRYLWNGPNGEPRAAAQILARRIGPSSLDLKIQYCPKGPVLDWQDKSVAQYVLNELGNFASEQGVVQLKIDPDVPLGWGVPKNESEQPTEVGARIETILENSGWQPSPEQIQFRNTMILDLSQPEEDILAEMKSKTRYNVRLAGRRGVEIRRGGPEDIDLLYKMFAETSVRDDFSIRSRDYYRAVWGKFIRENLAQPLIAEVEGEPVAGLIVYRFGLQSWYLYGMSIDKHRDKMPNYLLQWEAIKWSKDHGCTAYDLWGAPDEFNRDDPMWGVYRFKRGFKADVVRTIGAWDFAPRPVFYRAYHYFTPALLWLMRIIGRHQTAGALDN